MYVSPQVCSAHRDQNRALDPSGAEVMEGGQLTSMWVLGNGPLLILDLYLVSS